jgi:hypothetical protein
MTELGEYLKKRELEKDILSSGHSEWSMPGGACVRWPPANPVNGWQMRVSTTTSFAAFGGRAAGFDIVRAQDFAETSGLMMVRSCLHG